MSKDVYMFVLNGIDGQIITAMTKQLSEKAAQYNASLVLV